MHLQQSSAIWLCPSLLLPLRLRKRSAQIGPANWWSWLARQAESRSERKSTKKEGREEDAAAAHFLISKATSVHTLADFWEESELYHQRWRKGDENRMERGGWKNVPSSPSIIIFYILLVPTQSWHFELVVNFLRSEPNTYFKPLGSDSLQINLLWTLHMWSRHF